MDKVPKKEYSDEEREMLMKENRKDMKLLSQILNKYKGSCGDDEDFSPDDKDMQDLFSLLEKQEQLKKKHNVGVHKISEKESEEIDSILWEQLSGRPPTEKDKEEQRKIDAEVGTGMDGLTVLREKYNYSVYRCNCCGNNNGVSLKCSRCKGVRYCNADCQRKDWKSHKPRCIPHDEEKEKRSVGAV